MDSLTGTTVPLHLAILGHIAPSWCYLRRSHEDLARAASDPKAKPGPDGRRPVYIAGAEDVRTTTTNSEHK
jgi:hypothetical protein